MKGTVKVIAVLLMAAALLGSFPLWLGGVSHITMHMTVYKRMEQQG